jgi:hypothetical protein
MPNSKRKPDSQGPTVCNLTCEICGHHHQVVLSGDDTVEKFRARFAADHKKHGGCTIFFTEP